MGYEDVRVLRCMIGPLHEMNWSFPTGYSFRRPQEEDSMLISQLFFDANIDEPWHQPVTAKTFENGTKVYFDETKTKRIPSASSICLHNKTGEAVGACLISLDDGIPFVYDLHVLKKHRRKGIASNLMKLSINETHAAYSFLKLYVIDGNPAKTLYDNLGFIAGDPIHMMKFKIHEDITA